MRSTKKTSLKLVKLCCRALDGKKAEDLRVFDVSAQSSITDYLILATGTSEPHLRAMREELEQVLAEGGVSIVGVENTPGSGWTVFDAFEVMVHLFTKVNRTKYRLELLWNDAKPLSVEMLTGQMPVKRRRVARRTTKRSSLKARRSI